MDGDKFEVSLRRSVRVPDAVRVERCARLPEFGPRVFFFSGGSALRETSRVLKHYTHNSIHLITPFDSGGSSAVLREAFHILGVGDLRNRLMALADESDLGSPEVATLFSYRLAKGAPQEDLRRELEALVGGEHPLVEAVPRSLRQIVRTHLRKFVQKAPDDFDLRGASIGNLILAGGYLVNQRDLDSVLYLFSKLVSVRGTVRPSAMADAHLAARHASGEVTVGQHRIGKVESAQRGSIVDLELVPSLDGGDPITVDADPVSLELVGEADLICYAIGSFFGSILANLLPAGIGSRVAARECPKVYVPNTGADPEMQGYSLSTAVDRLIEFVRRDAGSEVPIERILNHVVIDRAGGKYGFELDVERVEAHGIDVIDLPLASADGASIDPQRLVEVLLSLS